MDPVIPFGSGDGISNLWCPDRAESVTERTSRFYTAKSCKQRSHADETLHNSNSRRHAFAKG